MTINRTSLYYKPKSENSENVEIMHIMDKYYTDHPTAGVLTMKSVLQMEGFSVNEKRVRRLLRKMGIQAIYPQRKLTKLGQAEYVHPYLLKGLEVEHAYQVRSTVIMTYPRRHGYVIV